MIVAGIFDIISKVCNYDFNTLIGEFDMSVCYNCNKPLKGKGFKRWKNRNFCSVACVDKYKEFHGKAKKKGFYLI